MTNCCQQVQKRSGQRDKSKCLHPSLKQIGGSVMVQGGISASGIGDVVKIYGIIIALESTMQYHLEGFWQQLHFFQNDKETHSCPCFNKSLHLFSIFLQNIKKLLAIQKILRIALGSLWDFSLWSLSHPSLSSCDPELDVR